MLQCGQYSTLNHAVHRFIAHSTRNYGHITSFSCFHLTTIRQCDHHASVQNYVDIVLLDQFLGNQTITCTTIHQIYNIKQIGQLAFFIMGWLVLVYRLWELFKSFTKIAMRVDIILVPTTTGARNNLMPDD